MNTWKRGRWVVLGCVLIVGSIVLLFGVRRLVLGGETQTPPLGAGSGQVVGATTATTSSTDPDAVHEQWVAAMQHDDQAAAVALSAPQDKQAGEVDAALQMMRRYVPANAETGGVTSVDVQPATVSGDERVGTSVWTFVKSKACFKATLAQDGEKNWRVRHWERIPCR